MGVSPADHCVLKKFLMWAAELLAAAFGVGWHPEGWGGVFAWALKMSSGFLEMWGCSPVQVVWGLAGSGLGLPPAGGGCCEHSWLL